MKNKKQFRKFVLIWFGQFLSILGSGLTSFGLSVWIFYSTGAATPFALSFLCSILPAVLFAPFAGSFADRKKRKAIIMVTDSVDALLKVIMAILLYTDTMQVWMVYPIMFLSSTLSTFQGPAFNASIPMIVEREHIGRANGMLQLSQAAQSMIAPILAGALYPFLKLQGLLVIDFVSFTFAIITIAVVAIPQEKIEQIDGQPKSMIGLAYKDFAFSFNYLRKIDKLMSHIAVFAILNFIANMCMILVGPMILCNYDSTTYGLIQTIYGVAMIIGGLIASVLPEAKNKVSRMFGVLILSGVGLIITGISPKWICIALGMFVFYLMVPYANTLFQTIFQTSVESTMLGRAGAVVNALLKLVSPIACVLAGPLADNVFGPMMMENGLLGKSFVGGLIGSGIGRGSGMIFIICGMILSAICIVMLLQTRSKKDGRHHGIRKGNNA